LIEPSELDDLEVGVFFRGLVVGHAACHSTARLATVEGKMAHVLRVANDVRHGHRGAPRRCEQDEPAQPGGRHNRLQILNVFFKGEFDGLSIGETAAAPIVADDAMSSRQHQQPGTPDRAVPIEFEVADPVADP